jgi:hypothetical protein
MKGNNMKTITLKVEGISQSQWSTFVLELNLMKKAWKRYGVEVELKTPSINKIITLGNSRGDKAINPKRKKNHIVNIFG